MYLLRQDSGREVSPYGQARQQQELMEPETGAVINAMATEAYRGIGTLSADIAAYGVSSADETGSPLTREQYEQSEFYRPSMPYYRGITEGAAQRLSVFQDETDARQELIADATSGQYAAGLAAAFTIGMTEPKNVATGLVTSLALTPAAGMIRPAGSIRRLMKMRQQSGQWGGKIALGAIEGGVSAAIAEPSNQYSAGILKQDYTMADSAWNIALSTAFGVGASVAGIGATDVPKIVRDKWERHGAKTPDIIAAEMDTAVSQLAQGKRVDVGAVERTSAGEIAKLPIVEQAAAAESFVRYTETPEFKTRFEGSKIVDNAGAPLRVLHGGAAITEPLRSSVTSDGLRSGEGIYFTTDELAARAYADKAQRETGSSATYPVYLDIKNPMVVEDSGFWQKLRDRNKPITKTEKYKRGSESSFLTKERITELQGQGFDGIINKASNEYVAFSQDQIIPAFGADDLPAITARMTAENGKNIQKSVLSDLDPNNDTAIDTAAWNQIDDMEETMLTDTEKAAQADYETYIKEISAMKREGQLTKADEDAMLEALNSVNEKELNSAYDDLYACLTRG